MDKEGFENVDRNYQHELAGHKQQIEQKWEAYYANKKYVGTPEMQAKARANDNVQKKQRISADLAGVKQTLDKKIFGDKGRQGHLDEFKKQEELKRRTEQIRKDFQKRSNDNNRNR